LFKGRFWLLIFRFFQVSASLNLLQNMLSRFPDPGSGTAFLCPVSFWPAENRTNSLPVFFEKPKTKTEKTVFWVSSGTFR
jgi:hypothetical protein